MRSFEAVAKVFPSLAKAIALIGSLAARVGLVTTSPLSALYTTRISEMTTKRRVPSVLKVQLKMTLELGGSGLGIC